MPRFDHFHVIRNGKAQDTKDADATWQLRRGANELEVWAVNAAGVRGASSRAGSRTVRTEGSRSPVGGSRAGANVVGEHAEH
jgi:hypothetical protein